MADRYAENKTRFHLLIDKELKAQLESMAKEDERSLNNYINIILKEYVNSHK